VNVRQSVSARARRTRAQSEGCQYKDFGESNRAAYSNAQRWLDGELADGRAFIAGDTLSMADICALSTVDFAH